MFNKKQETILLINKIKNSITYDLNRKNLLWMDIPEIIINSDSTKTNKNIIVRFNRGIGNSRASSINAIYMPFVLRTTYNSLFKRNIPVTTNIHIYNCRQQSF